MSFLPYGETSGFGWFGAFGTSAALHGGAVFALAALGSTTLTIAAEAPAPPPEFQVSVEELDADTLAGLLEQAGLAGTDGEEEAETNLAESTEAEPDGISPLDEVEGLEDPIDAPDPPGALPLEMPDVTEADTATSLDPELVSSDADVETLTPLSPDLTTLEPVALDPIIPDPTDPTAALEVETISPIMSDSSPISVADGVGTDQSPLETVTVTAIENLEVAAITTAPETAITSPLAETIGQVQPAATVPSAPAPPTAQDLAVRDLITRIQNQPQPTCLLALPRRDGADGVGLALVAAQEQAMETYTRALLSADDAGLRQTRTLVDPRQCPALEFVAASDPYPAMQIGIQIDATFVTSGGVITGSLRGIGARFLTLTMVDDNGVVTDLQRFTTTSGNVARFDVPVTRLGLARDTRPMILAIVSDAPPTQLRARLGLLAEDVFQDAVTDSLGDVRLGLVAVDIR